MGTRAKQGLMGTEKSEAGTYGKKTRATGDEAATKWRMADNNRYSSSHEVLG